MFKFAILGDQCLLLSNEANWPVAAYVKRIVLNENVCSFYKEIVGFFIIGIFDSVYRQIVGNKERSKVGRGLTTHRSFEITI